ncbi:restriction endonuclease [Shewanella algae]|uniref:restriction endonuclease n=1 Tax=Shewanella algae TaxID=38313 RepID=UPI001AAE0BD5|nr:restriction endonuclease [Shewanella algae]MBO2649042.1 restriction endonuclease [Shewanella algae]
MDDLTKHYLNKLSSYKEDDFTKEIIAPLFEAMGYQRVEFNGGPFERGRDLIATIKIPPNRKPKIIYVQSKKLEIKKEIVQEFYLI